MQLTALNPDRSCIILEKMCVGVDAFLFSHDL